MRLTGLIILLIFFAFYQRFETYPAASIHFSNVLFRFASLVGVVGYAIAEPR